MLREQRVDHRGVPVELADDVIQPGLAVAGRRDWWATRRPMTPIVIAGMWLLFCLTLLLTVGAMAQSFRNPNSDLTERVLYAVLGAASATLAIAFGYRVYRNFRRYSKRDKP
jgi:hypothetical protein